MYHHVWNVSCPMKATSKVNKLFGLTKTPIFYIIIVAVAATSLLHQKANDIRQKCISWQSYHSSQMISDRDFKFITLYEKVTADNRAEFVQQHAMEMAETFLTMLSTVSKDETIQYILCLIDELFLEDRNRVEIFHTYCSKHKETLWKHFFPLLLREDEFIQNMVSFTKSFIVQ